MDTAPARPNTRHVLPSLIEAIDVRTLAIDLLVGWLVWVTVLLAGCIRATGSSVSAYRLLEFFDKNWEPAFLWSLPVVLIISLAHYARLGRPWHAPFTTCVLYAGPMSIGGIGFTLQGQLYRTLPSTHGTQETMGFALILFYLIGIIYLAIKARNKAPQAIAAFLVPPYVGAVLCVAVAFMQVLTSVQYRYRAAYQLTVRTIETVNGEVHISGTLHVEKPAAYVFSAVGNSPFPVSGWDEEPATLIWEKGIPSARGDYPFDVTCKKIMPPAASFSSDIPGPATTSYVGYSNRPLASLLVSVKEDGDSYAKPLKPLPISIWDAPNYAPGITENAKPASP